MVKTLSEVGESTISKALSHPLLATENLPETLKGAIAMADSVGKMSLVEESDPKTTNYGISMSTDSSIGGISSTFTENDGASNVNGGIAISEAINKGITKVIGMLAI